MNKYLEACSKYKKVADEYINYEISRIKRNSRLFNESKSDLYYILMSNDIRKLESCLYPKKNKKMY